MATNDVVLGGGRATGMFYHAPAGTALPAYPGESLDPAWVEVGDVSEDGITYSPAHSFETLKNWANKVVRLLPGSDSQTVKAALMDTTEEVFKTIFGDDQVTITPANSAHGKLISVDTDSNITPVEEAYLFIMKDGDNMMLIGTTHGYISEISDIGFKATEAINWEATITASDKWVIIDDNGQTTEES